MRIIATILARMGSTRLPGKVLAPVLGRPLLACLVERVERIPQLDDIVIATTYDPADDAIEHLADELGVGCRRGAAAKVLERLEDAAAESLADVVIQLSAASPLVDPIIASRLIERFLRADYDGVTNVGETCWPRGTEIEVVSAKALVDVAKRTSGHSEIAFVSEYMAQHAGQFDVEPYPPLATHCRPELSLRVETAEDLALVRAIYERLYMENPRFGLDDVLDLLDQSPELLETQAASR